MKYFSQPNEPDGDIQYALDWIPKKHEVFFWSAQTKQELIDGLKQWKRNNREYLYIASHGDSDGIWNQKSGGEIITKDELKDIVKGTALVILAGCNTQSIAEYLASSKICDCIGSTKKVNHKECLIIIQEMLDKLWNEKEKKWNLKSNIDHVNEINKFAKAKYGKENLFCLYDNQAPKQKSKIMEKAFENKLQP
jgi:hypothetical protein